MQIIPLKAFPNLFLFFDEMKSKRLVPQKLFGLN